MVEWIKMGSIGNFFGWPTVLGGIACVALGMNSCCDYMGEEIFRGTIDDKEVVYSEGRFDGLRGGPGSRKNVMIIQSNSSKLVFEDRYNHDSIDWKNETSPDLEKADLDKVTLIRDEERTVYGGFNPRPDLTTLDGKHEAGVLKSSTIMYNSFRVIIRERERTDYTKSHSAIEAVIGDAISEPLVP
jgi:hypothetical protein